MPLFCALQGTYGDICNFPQQQYDRALDAAEDAQELSAEEEEEEDEDEEPEVVLAELPDDYDEEEDLEDVHEVAPEIPAETRRASPSKPRGRTKQPPQKAARRGPYVEIEYEDENDALPMRVAADARGR